ncbi:MAG: pyridoxamine 5'-phosphate oxidase [Thiotrichaceae bacterium]|nr:pyridoxamine 5'-phosphate oxidase [Thiotrichaceae bacterium]
MDISEYRREYMQSGLGRDQLNNDPMLQFETWFKQACEVDVVDANAMSLATVSAGGRPSIRTVLLKTFDQQGFVFFTNYTSQKAQEIAENSSVAALFPWTELERQVEVCGKAERISIAESLKYITSRPRGSQLGAWVSRQSSVIDSRQTLVKRMANLKERFANGAIPNPTFWGGYRIVPETIEFWQGREGRLHDRFEYTKANGEWCTQRLAP